MNPCPVTEGMDAGFSAVPVRLTMKEYVPLFDRLHRRDVAINRNVDKAINRPVQIKASEFYTSPQELDEMRRAAFDSLMWGNPRPTASYNYRTKAAPFDLEEQIREADKELPFYDYPQPRPPHRVQVTREWMEAQEMLVREFYPHHQFVWRVAGDPKNWRQPPSKAQSTGWGNMPPPQSDKVVSHDFAAEGVRNMDDMTDRWSYNWVCASLQHQFHGWWQTSVLQSNITLYLLAVEAGDMVVYAKQCCVHRAEVVTAFTTHQGY